MDEVYYPDVDTANTRTVRFLVADGESFFSDELSDAEHQVEMLAPGIPGYRVTSTDKQGRYRLTKIVIADPDRSTLLLQVGFEVLRPGKPLQLYLFVEPHIGNQGDGNDAWVGRYLGIPMLFAKRGDTALAVACDQLFQQRTCGYSEKSDALTDLRSHCRLTKLYTRAPSGKVALCGEVDLQANPQQFLVSVGFGRSEDEAALLARASVSRRFDEAIAVFQKEWQARQAGHWEPHTLSEREAFVYRASTAVLDTHELQMFPGGMVASLSIPWGFAKTDEEVVGYHMLWPRDMVQTALGKLAAGDAAGASRTLFYLACTQREDGSWSQNMWKTGKPHWTSVQMDTIALPILLAHRLHRESEHHGFDPWPMVRSAAEYLLRYGPATQQERWEKLSGYSVSSMAAEIVALLAAADFADAAGHQREADLLRETADSWHALIDDLLYIEGGQLANEHNVSGFYMRIAPPEAIKVLRPGDLMLKFSDIEGQQEHPAWSVVSPDALTLVRYGLRRADDPRMQDTVIVIDATLRFDTKTGPGWVRSSFDGYGEKKDGSPYKETGIGRCWPLLAGERGHYAVAAGDQDFARELLATLARQTSTCGTMPEQVWNADDIPDRELFNGRANGSGMPLAWAHAEYIRLVRSLEEGCIWDLPPLTNERYARHNTPSHVEIWSEACPRTWIREGKTLRLDLDEPGRATWRTPDGVRSTCSTQAPLMGRHCIYLPAEAVKAGSSLVVKVQKDGGEMLHLNLRVVGARS